MRAVTLKLINQAPALVAFGLRTGLLSVTPQPPVDSRGKYYEQQLVAAREGMRRLRMRRGVAKLD